MSVVLPTRVKYAVGTQVVNHYDPVQAVRTITAIEFGAPIPGMGLDTMDVWIVTDAPGDGLDHADVWYHFRVIGPA